MRPKWTVEQLLNELQDSYEYHYNEIVDKNNNRNKDISNSLFLLAVLEKQIQLLEWVLKINSDTY